MPSMYSEMKMMHINVEWRLGHPSYCRIYDLYGIISMFLHLHPFFIEDVALPIPWSMLDPPELFPIYSLRP